MWSRRTIVLSVLAALAVPASAQALNREYYEPVWTKPVTANANTWWWQVGNDYASQGKTAAQVAWCFRYRQGPYPNTQGVPETGWRFHDGTSWTGNPTNGSLPAKSCFSLNNNGPSPLAFQVAGMTAGLPYTYCNQEWLVFAGSWSKSAIPEKCTQTRIDNVAPTTSVTLNNGAQWTNNPTVDVRFGFADTVGEAQPVTFACGQLGASACTPNAEVAACSNYPAAPNRSCTYGYGNPADGATLQQCGRVADKAIPDQTPQTNPNGPSYQPITTPPNPGNTLHNLSAVACASIRIDRTSPAFAPNTPSTAFAGQEVSFSVTDATSGVKGTPTWTIDGTSRIGTTVSHTFAATGNKSLSVPVVDNAGNATTLTRSIMVTDAPAPAVALNPEAMAFSTKQNATGATQVLTVSNTGNANLGITTVAFGAGSNSRFERPAGDLGTCTNGGTVAAGQSCTVKLRFTPQGGDVADSTYEGALQITTNAAGSPHTVELDGVVTSNLDTPPGVSPASVAFGTQPVGSVVTKTFTFTNNGDQFMPLDLESIALTGSAQITRPAGAAGGTCTAPQTYTGGNSCTIVLRYEPTTQDLQNATLTLEHNYNGGGTTTIPISGTGGAPGSAPIAGEDGGDTAGGTGAEAYAGEGGVGGEAPIEPSAKAGFAKLSGGVMTVAMNDAALVRAAGAGRVVAARAGKLALRVVSRFMFGPGRLTLPVGIKASAGGTVELKLTRRGRTVAVGKVRLLRAGGYTFGLALPRAVGRGAHRLTGTFTPRRGGAARSTVRVRLAPARAGAKAPEKAPPPPAIGRWIGLF